MNAVRLRGRDGLRLTLVRLGGEYVLTISRDDQSHEESYTNRDDAWTRIGALRGAA